MASIAVPEILDRVACAGAAGLAYPAAEPERRDLELCLAQGIPLEIREGRVRLRRDRDLLVPAWIEEETPLVAWDRLKVLGYFEAGSTNEEALSRARQGTEGGTVIYAECQTAGRGRKGRQWVSPARCGLYFSIILRPTQPPNHWALLALAAAVAAAHALREFSQEGVIPRPLDLELKWPNDVLISGKKAAGILLETSAAAGWLSAAVLGVGMNVSPGPLPDELRAQVTSVGEEAGVQVPRRHLLARFLYHFQLGYDLFERGAHAKILDQWKKSSSMWNNTPVWIVEEGAARPAVTSGLTDSGALVVRNLDGAEEVILAGDVSIRRLAPEER